MRFALVGDHPHAQAFAAAALESGHTVAGYCGAAPEFARTLNASVRVTPDLEELLADPAIEAVIVGVPLEKRLDVCRRVLQSERSAVVVLPVDEKPDGVYELNMLQGDTHQVLVPLLPEAVIDLPPLPAGAWLDVTFTNPVEALLHIDETGRHAAFPGWTLVRRLTGEVVEVSAFAAADEVTPHSVTFVSGKAEKATFRLRYQRAEGPPTTRIELIAPTESVPLVLNEEAAWRHLVDEFVSAVAALKTAPHAEPAAGPRLEATARVSWRDAIRVAELDDAAARSLVKRRAVLLEYQEANEEVGFKGTMTLIGCAMLWLVIMLLMLSAWQPWLGWLILPAIVVFLGLQVLGVIARR